MHEPVVNLAALELLFAPHEEPNQHRARAQGSQPAQTQKGRRPSRIIIAQSLLLQRPMPRFTWTLEPDGAIKVKVTDTPKAVTLWQATNPQARDFRLETFGPKWTSSPLALDRGQCVARVPEPLQGWTAFMVELTYDGPDNHPLKLTTNVRVVPEKLDHVFAPNPAAIRGR